MNIPGAGVLEQTLPALPLDILPDLPVISNVKAAYADPSTRLVTLLGVYSVGAIGIANTKLLKSAKAKKLVSTLGKASGVAAIALYLADQMNGDDGIDVDPVAGLGFLGRSRSGPVRMNLPAFAARAAAQQAASRGARPSRYRVERRRRGDGIPGGASDPVVVIKRIRRVIRQGGYGDASPCRSPPHSHRGPQEPPRASPSSASAPAALPAPSDDDPAPPRAVVPDREPRCAVHVAGSAGHPVIHARKSG